MIENKILSNALHKRYSHLRISFFEILKTVYRPYYAPICDLTNIFDRSNNCLEIGCGFGPIIFSLYDAKLVESVSGYDVDKLSLEIAKSAVKAGEKIEFYINNDLKNINLKNFDSIVFFDLLHHLNSSEQFTILTEIFKNSSSFTKIYIKDLNPRPYIKAVFNRITDYVSSRSSVNYIDSNLIIDIANSYGFEVVFIKLKFNSLWSHYLIKFKKNNVNN